jgi:TRAP-type C4-dicarboxylate transport system substrate-binding protein
VPSRRTVLAAAAAASLFACAPGALAQQTIKLTISSGHPPAFLWVRLLDEFFVPEVDKRLAAAGGKHRIEWTKAWGGTLAKVGQESVAIKDGVSDMGFVGTLFEAARFPLQNVSYFTPFITDDIFLVSRVVADLQGRVPQMNDAWAKNNLVYLAGASLDAYHLFSSFPVRSVDDLKGRKISAPGPSANWIKGTGAVAVAGNLTTYYEDIKSGVSEGALAFATGGWGAKLHEVAPHVTKANFGAMYAGGIVINRGRFDKLPPEVQKVFREVGIEYTQRFATTQAQTADALLKKMADAGAKIYELPAAERKRWADTLPPVGKTWATELQGKGLPANDVLNGFMDGLAKAGVKVPRDWSK